MRDSLTTHVVSSGVANSNVGQRLTDKVKLARLRFEWRARVDKREAMLLVVYNLSLCAVLDELVVEHGARVLYRRNGRVETKRSGELLGPDRALAIWRPNAVL